MIRKGWTLTCASSFASPCTCCSAARPRPLPQSWQVSERGTPQAGASSSPTLDQALARARDELAKGRLTHAAAALESAAGGTAAGPLVQAWVSDARRRAVVEQGARLLGAHAAAISASLT